MQWEELEVWGWKLEEGRVFKYSRQNAASFKLQAARRKVNVIPMKIGISWEMRGCEAGKAVSRNKIPEPRN